MLFTIWHLAGGEQGGAMEVSGRHLEAEEGHYLPEQDRNSLNDSEGLLNVHYLNKITPNLKNKRNSVIFIYNSRNQVEITFLFTLLIV